MRLNNISVMRTSGIDVVGKKRWSLGAGTLDLGLNATYLFDFSEAQFAHSPQTTLLDTVGNPISFRLRGSANWAFREFGVAGFLNYSDSYRDVVSEPTRSVSSWTTLDLQLSYQIGRTGPEALRNTAISLSAQNVLDSDPPFVNNPLGVGYDNANADLLGRFVSFRMRKAW
jgi:hypothetical protein